MWTLFTCCLFDLRLLASLLNVPLFALAARAVERLLGARAFGLFLACVSLTGALSVTCLALGAYAALRVGSLMYVRSLARARARRPAFSPERRLRR